MESIYTELALDWSKNEGARTDNAFSPISEVCDGRVSPSKIAYFLGKKIQPEMFFLCVKKIHF